MTLVDFRSTCLSVILLTSCGGSSYAVSSKAVDAGTAGTDADASSEAAVDLYNVLAPDTTDASEDVTAAAANEAAGLDVSEIDAGGEADASTGPPPCPVAPYAHAANLACTELDGAIRQPYCPSAECDDAGNVVFCCTGTPIACGPCDGGRGRVRDH